MTTWSRRILLVAALAALPVLAACGSDDGAPDGVRLTEEDAGRTVAVASGGTLIVALESNPSTGYSWAVVEPLPDQLTAEGEPEFVQEEPSPPPGAPGTEVFTFQVSGSGTADLEMEYRRSFEPGAAPEDTFAVTISVE